MSRKRRADSGSPRDRRRGAPRSTVFTADQVRLFHIEVDLVRQVHDGRHEVPEGFGFGKVPRLFLAPDYVYAELERLAEEERRERASRKVRRRKQQPEEVPA